MYNLPANTDSAKIKENIILLCRQLVEVLFDDKGSEIERLHLAPSRETFDEFIAKKNNSENP